MSFVLEWVLFFKFHYIVLFTAEFICSAHAQLSNWSRGTFQQHTLLWIYTFSNWSLCPHRWYTSLPRTLTSCYSYCSVVVSAFLVRSMESSSISHQILTNLNNLRYAVSNHGSRSQDVGPMSRKKELIHSNLCMPGVAGCCYTDFLLLRAGIRLADCSWQLQSLQ